VITPARLPGLEAQRAIAALLVVGLHVQAVFGIWLPGWFSKGYLAVDFFLMLSGFLMMRHGGAKLAAGISPLAFLAARYRRLWGVMALGGLIGAPFLWSRAGSLGAFLPPFAANLALLPFPFDGVLFALNIPAWYVFYELVANAAFALVLFRLPTRWLALLAALLLVVTMRIACAFDTLDLGARPETFLPAFPRIFLAFTLGMLAARVPLPRIPGSLGLAALPFAAIGSRVIEWTGAEFDLAFVVLVCPLALIGALAWRHDAPLIRAAGAVSFPLFAVHLPVLEAMRELGYAWPAALCMALLTAGAIAWWTNRPAHSMASPTT
jgi:peptidoglycan/LPS O-acetylase OafA/YrhL